MLVLFLNAAMNCNLDGNWKITCTNFTHFLSFAGLLLIILRIFVNHPFSSRLSYPSKLRGLAKALPLHKTCSQSSTEGEYISNEAAYQRMPNPFKNYTPYKTNFFQVFYRGCTDFKWSSLPDCIVKEWVTRVHLFVTCWTVLICVKILHKTTFANCNEQ